MQTSPITPESLVYLLSIDSKVLNNGMWDAAINEDDLFFCYLKSNRAYCDMVSLKLAELKESEENAIPMFVNAMSVLTADYSVRRPSQWELLSRVASLVALYLYCAPEEYCYMDPVYDILHMSYTKQDICDEAIRMATTCGGIRGGADKVHTVKSVRIGIVKLLMLLWDYHKDALLETQRTECERIKALTDKACAEV